MSKPFLLLVILLVSGCTYVNADTEKGVVQVFTFMTSRQDVIVERLPDGTSRWTAKRSDADANLAEAILNVSRVAVKAAGSP